MLDYKQKLTAEKLEKRWIDMEEVDIDCFRGAFDYTIEKVREEIKKFSYSSPSITAPNGKYCRARNNLWTNGFWPGMLWTAYAATGEKDFLKAGKLQSVLFRERVDTDYKLNHHDIGFLYSLSTVADYILTGDKTAWQTSIMAAEMLTRMYREVPGIIQRGGDMNDINDPLTGVFIVDCMNNVPLLFWAAEQTGDEKFYNIAYNHMKNSINSIVQPDGRVVQHGIANVVTGEITADSSQSQGKGGDDAAWGRGQAWAVAGLPITYAYTGDEEFLEAFKSVTNYFLNRMPSDLVSNWDLYYTDDETQRDTSASAIAVCGLLEGVKHLNDDDPYKKIYKNAALNILKSLTEKYLTKGEPENMGLLNAGVYGYGWKGVDEPTIFGDYYYMEALYRLLCNGKCFW